MQASGALEHTYICMYACAFFNKHSLHIGMQQQQQWTVVQRNQLNLQFLLPNAMAGSRFRNEQAIVGDF